MKHLLQISTLILSGLALCATVANADSPTTTTLLNLNVTCGDINATTQPFDNGHCTEGMVTFRGTNFPNTVYVRVLSYPAGKLIDDGEYVTSGSGDLVFTQTLVPAGGYTVRVSADNSESVVYALMTIYTDSL